MTKETYVAHRTNSTQFDLFPFTASAQRLNELWFAIVCEAYTVHTHRIWKCWLCLDFAKGLWLIDGVIYLSALHIFTVVPWRKSTGTHKARTCIHRNTRKVCANIVYLSPFLHGTSLNQNAGVKHNKNLLHNDLIFIRCVYKRISGDILTAETRCVENRAWIRLVCTKLLLCLSSPASATHLGTSLLFFCMCDCQEWTRWERSKKKALCARETNNRRRNSIWWTDFFAPCRRLFSGKWGKIKPNCVQLKSYEAFWLVFSNGVCGWFARIRLLSTFCGINWIWLL